MKKKPALKGQGFFSARGGLLGGVNTGMFGGLRGIFGGRQYTGKPVALAPSLTLDSARGDTLGNFAYTGSGTMATYVDAAKKLQRGTTNQIRVNNITLPWGELRKLWRKEGARTNRCTNYNYAPTDTTGLTAGGDGAAVLSVVSDPGTLLSLAVDMNEHYNQVIDISTVCTKLIKLDNSAGVAAAYVEAAGGAADTTNLHSISAFVSVSTGTGSLSLGGTAATVNVTGATLAWKALPNFVPADTTSHLRFTVPAGSTGYMILNQLESGAHASSPILVAGASATRPLDSIRDTSFSSRAYYNASAGAVMVDAYFADINNNPGSQHLAFLSNNSGFTYCMSAYLINGRSKFRTRTYINSVSQFSSDTGSVDQNFAHCPVGFTWTDGSDVTVVNAALDNYNFTVSGPQVGITTLDIGQRLSSSDPMNGHIGRILIWNARPGYADIGAAIDFSHDYAVPTQGQSSIATTWNAQDTAANDGEKAYIAAMNGFFPAVRNWQMHNAISGSSIQDINNASGCWYDIVAHGPGPLYTRAVQMINGFKAGGGLFTGRCLEANGHESDINATPANLTEGYNYVLNGLMAAAGISKLIFEPMGRREDANANTKGYQNMRSFHWAWIAANVAKALGGAERLDQPMHTDGVHLTDVGDQAQGPRRARNNIAWAASASVSGPVLGPVISGAVLTGSTIVVSLLHPTGITDFTPTSGIRGFKFFDQAALPATELGGPTGAIIDYTAVRTNATTITLTLASAPSTSGILYYGYGVLWEVSTFVDRTKLVLGNDAYTLPLNSFAAALPYVQTGDFLGADFNNADFNV